MTNIITGPIGIGKTVICERIIEIAECRGYSCGGVITPKTSSGDILVVDVCTRENRILASTSKKYTGPSTERFSFNSEGIAFGIKAIERGFLCKILFIDEIGCLERKGEGFVRIFELFNKGVALRTVVVIRPELLPIFSHRLSPEPKIYEVTTQNRNQLPAEIFSLIVNV